MIINNGIINQGNNNINIININYEKITEELIILSKNSDENLEQAINASKNKDSSKLIKLLKGLKTETINLISKLGLTTLEKLIEHLIFK